jgi:hypothetical protein
MVKPMSLSLALAFVLGGCAPARTTLGQVDNAAILRAMVAVKTDIATEVRATATATVEAVGIKIDNAVRASAGRDVNLFDYWAIRIAVTVAGLVVLAVVGYVIYDRWADRRNGRKSAPPAGTL